MTKMLNRIPVTERLIGAGLRQARQRANMTQVGLSKRIGLSFQQLGKYENGRDRVSLSRFMEIASAMAVEPTALLSEIIAAHPTITDLTQPEDFDQ